MPTIYSPYLNFDPAYINASNPEYILQEGAGPKRGRFDLCFAQIGSCVAVGSAIGGVRGLMHGLSETRDLQGSVKRSQLINYTMKSGSSIANKLGCISVMYSAFGVLFSYLREKDDDINTGKQICIHENTDDISFFFCYFQFSSLQLFREDSQDFSTSRPRV